jgi:DeoR/GlpR family transcriptional regulator of sugar metabolism
VPQFGPNGLEEIYQIFARKGLDFSFLLKKYSSRHIILPIHMGSLPLISKRTDRRASLIRLLQENESISIEQLAQATGVSQSTLRRELHQLTEEGLVKVNLGQVSLAASSEEMPFAFRKMVNNELKRKIARASLELIQNGESIFIAGGTTTLELARLLPGQRRLTVITNALRVADLLADVPGIDLVVLGGAMRPGEQTMHGHLTEWGVHQFRADKLIYGTEAVSLQHGVTHSQIVEVSTDRALAAAATQVIVLADHTKFGKVAPAFVFALDKVHILVSDRDLPDETVRGLRSRHVQLILA